MLDARAFQLRDHGVAKSGPKKTDEPRGRAGLSLALHLVRLLSRCGALGCDRRLRSRCAIGERSIATGMRTFGGVPAGAVAASRWG